jgi:hypothetical protein
MSILDRICADQKTLDGIYDRYEKYKTSRNVGFFVPVDALVVGNKVVINTGDKSYNTKNELRENLKLWFTSDNDVKAFEECLWENRNRNIVTIILIETSEFNVGSIVLFPVIRGSAKANIIYCDDIQAFSHM